VDVEVLYTLVPLRERHDSNTANRTMTFFADIPSPENTPCVNPLRASSIPTTHSFHTNSDKYTTTSRCNKRRVFRMSASSLANLRTSVSLFPRTREAPCLSDAVLLKKPAPRHKQSERSHKGATEEGMAIP
jgi:hypothetical protein